SADDPVAVLARGHHAITAEGLPTAQPLVEDLQPHHLLGVVRGAGVTTNGVPYYGNGGAAACGGIRVATDTVQLYQSSLSGSRAGGGGSGASPAPTGGGVEGALSVAPPAPPLADLDTFTESNTINNSADTDPNIAGPYSLNGTWVPPLAIRD